MNSIMSTAELNSIMNAEKLRAFHEYDKQWLKEHKENVMNVTKVESASGKKKWYKSKTIWTGVTAVVTAFGAYSMGEITIMQLIMACFGALTVIFFRSGIEGLK